LIDVGRGFTAITVLQSALDDKSAVSSDLVAEVLEAGINPNNSESPDRSGHLQYSVQQLVKFLQQDKNFDRVRLARIEWGFLPLLDPEFSQVGPDTLVTAIESGPQFFVDLLERVYRGEHDRPSGEPLTEQEQLMAQHANRLLDGLSRLPGTQADGSLDCGYLGEWIAQVQSLSGQRDRRAICDLVLGQFIARGSQKPEGNWPPPNLAKLMEDVGSDEFFRGFINGVLNSRGVVSRDPRAGGELERRLAERYRRLAQHARPHSARLAEVFLELARHYDYDAKHEDDEAARLKLGR
jgi:hypothetical protein